MSDPVRPMAEEELHAFVDNQLDPEQRSAVLRYLQEHPEAGRRIADYSAQREALRAALLPMGDRPVPPALDLQRLIQQRLTRRYTVWRIAAAVVMAFGLGGAAGWFGRAGLGETSPAITMLAQEAAANHVVYTADRRRPTELGAEQRDDLARWVSNRLNHKVAPPDLAADGYRYMGGRLAATPDGPAGLFMYDDAQGLRVTVFVLPMQGAVSVPIQRVTMADVNGYAWIDNGVGYTVVGRLAPADLQRLAERVRRQFGGST